jgi:glycine cleavage system H lipoate-binding protein/ABC-type phosphate transport system substrate-binding protein
MKTTTSFFIGILLLLIYGNVSSKNVTGTDPASNNGSVIIRSTPDLYALTSQWAYAFNRFNPEAKIRVIKSSDREIDLNEGENLNFISKESKKAFNNEADWKMVVGRTVIAPIINSANPFVKELSKKGTSAEQLSQLFSNPTKQNWGTLLGTALIAPVHVYMLDDEFTIAGVANFLKASQIPLIGIKLANSQEVVSAVQNDPYAIGFCKVVNIMKPGDQSLLENIKLLPLDKNGNGSIDPMENIYGDLALFLRGVWIGKYPKALYSDIYAVCKVQPINQTEISFLKWVLTDGQQFLNQNGYSELVNNESQSQMDKIETPFISVPPSKDLSSIVGLVLIIIAGLTALGFVVRMIIRRSVAKKSVITGNVSGSCPGFDENAVVLPNGLYFDKTHTWAFMEKDGSVTLGMDDFMQHVTGPITRIEMKNKGEKIKKGDLLCAIKQSGKQLNLYAPVSGIIKKHNEALISNSSYLNSSPYTLGWVYVIEPLNWLKEIQFLDMADKYKRWLATEFPRLKDFFAATLTPGSLEYSQIVLQDGGVLKDGILADFGPEIWEDFQTNFLDN